MKRIIIVTDSAVVSGESRNAITAFLEGKGWSIWHWFQDLWLIDNAPDDLNLNMLRAEIAKAVPGTKHIFVMVPEGPLDYSGEVPAESIEWIRKHWKGALTS